ncbi:MAG: hypothetical protein KBF21_06030 [Thermoanaerobaculia bacterium]|nr:hypothetical protein [Thermoanaerobaculia bacterium]MBP9823764.1 hypothetical protein [Thermoanaerobaculia bacterium]
MPLPCLSFPSPDASPRRTPVPACGRHRGSAPGIFRRAAALALSMLALGAAVAGADGDPDPAFWTGGEVVLQLPFDMNFGGLDADAAGNLALAFDSPLLEGVDRGYWATVGDDSLGAYCEIDPGTGPGQDVRVLDLAFDDLGRLIALVMLHFDETLDLFMLVAYDFPACVLVPSFGVSGVVVLPTDPDYESDGFFDVSALSDGHLLVTGRTWNGLPATPLGRPLALEIGPAGNAITEFSPPFGSWEESAVAAEAVRASNGHTVLAVDEWDDSRDFVLLDFAADGTYLGPLGIPFDLWVEGSDGPFALAALDGDRVVVVGNARQYPEGDPSPSTTAAVAMARWPSAGGALELDTSFSGDGKWDGRVEHNATFFDVLRQGADRFVAVGSSWLPDQTQKILLARFLLDGSLDTTFGGTGTGLFTEDLPGTWWERATRVVPQNGRLVLGGIADIHFGVRAIGLVRRTSDLIFQGGFEQLNPPDWQVGP